ncbi:hypothetical protein BV20DRAFT_101186 [Pilatotrama ljubarskyi]|nr:hypothetical protein BV20DRAFT_101186 [Pilatotrama ljubarskyi]
MESVDRDRALPVRGIWDILRAVECGGGCQPIRVLARPSSHNADPRPEHPAVRTLRTPPPWHEPAAEVRMPAPAPDYPAFVGLVRGASLSLCTSDRAPRVGEYCSNAYARSSPAPRPALALALALWTCAQTSRPCPLQLTGSPSFGCPSTAPTELSPHAFTASRNAHRCSTPRPWSHDIELHSSSSGLGPGPPSQAQQERSRPLLLQR